MTAVPWYMPEKIPQSSRYRSSVGTDALSGLSRSHNEPPDGKRVFEGLSIQPWIPEALRRIHELRELKSGWDGYQAKPVRHDVAFFTLFFLQSILESTTASPSIVPLASGGLQVEWHLKDVDVEIEILAPYEVSLSFDDLLSGEEKDMSFSSADFTSLSPIISRLSISEK